jgi:dihydrofolate synthase/folylpolyglutamate synthase
MSWTAEEAEAYLDSLEPLGMRFGLERIHRLVGVLGMPQHRFASIHVVGTNGKSSVAEATAALLAAHGVRAGAYLSPHGERWAERVRAGGAEIGADAFAASVERVAQSVETVNRALEEGDAVTQFEAATAAAFVSLAAAGVEVGVIEAGLGGRLDATNVLPSRATVLTSVGLDHTQWLGETTLEIAAEKLAVLRDHTTLVVGPLEPDVERLATEVAQDHSAKLVKVRDLSPAVVLASPAPFARRNFAVALAAADVILERLDPEKVAAVAAGLELPGRMEVIEDDPPIVLDSAHNPAGAAALAEGLGPIAGERPVVACVAVLADKDALGLLEALAPKLAAVVATEIPAERLARAGRPGANSLSAADLAALARRAGIAHAESAPAPDAAAARAVELARERAGVALVCGSHYLLGYVPGR